MSERNVNHGMTFGLKNINQQQPNDFHDEPSIDQNIHN